MFHTTGSQAGRKSWNFSVEENVAKMHTRLPASVTVSMNASRPPESICRKARRKVYAYLEGELSPEEEQTIRQHIEICKYCYQSFQFERHFLERLQKLGDGPSTLAVELPGRGG